MAPKKKVSKKSPAKPKMCPRYVDANTVIMSDNPKLREATDSETSEKLPKGMMRVDAHNVVKV